MASSYGPFGSTTGTLQSATTGQTTPITKLSAYYTSAYVYGIRLYWGTTNSLYGVTNSVLADTIDDLDIDPMCQITYVLASGIVRGIRFQTICGRVMDAGLSPKNLTAFSGSYAFTDMAVYTGSVNSTTVIWGATVYYVSSSASCSPLPPLLRLYKTPDMAWPSLAIMAHAYVVVKSFMNVGKLRETLSIQAPSCDPSPSTSPSDTQLWYRTFRAQENCKEMFLVYLPSILIASSMGYHVFGKWAPRAVGALALLGAFFRHKYLNAYIEDENKRGKPFYYAALSMQPIFYLAVASSGYVAGQQLYRSIKGGCGCGCNGDGSKKKNASEHKEEGNE